MRTQTIAVLGALVLTLSFAGVATAAPFVDITYDLSDTTFSHVIPDCSVTTEGCLSFDLLGGSMKIRYTSDSASSMPILSGPATLQSLALAAYVVGYNTGFQSAPLLTAHLNVNLVSPVAGTLLSGGTLAIGTAQLRATGSRHCDLTFVTGACIIFGGVLTSILSPLGPYTSSAALTFAASPGPYGGARSTRQTVSGTIPVSVPLVLSPGQVLASGANILGREILREAEGHDPKVPPIPEPGTLLLLGAGAAGLALVGRATRRSRH